MSAWKRCERAFYVGAFQFFTTMSSIITADTLLNQNYDIKLLIFTSLGVSTINFFLAFFREMDREVEEKRYEELKECGYVKKNDHIIDNLLPL